MTQCEIIIVIATGLSPLSFKPLTNNNYAARQLASWFTTPT